MKDNTLHVGGRKYELDNNVYVVGFGKAVAGMARAVEDQLHHHIIDGIISVPHRLGTTLRELGKGWGSTHNLTFFFKTSITYLPKTTRS